MKILKFTNFEFKKMKKGGGTPIYQSPTNLDGIDSIIEDLKEIKYFPNTDSLYFTHKVIDEEKTIPAPSNRFIDDIKFIFGSNRLDYVTTIFDEDENRLNFIYSITYVMIQKGIQRLKMLKEMIFSYISLNSITESIFLRGLSDESLKTSLMMYIKKFKNENELNIWSYTGIRNIISGQQYKYGSFEIKNSKTTLKSSDANSLIFSSVKNKNIAKEAFDDARVSILYEDNSELGVIGNFDKNIQGIVSRTTLPLSGATLKTNENKINKAIYDKFKLKEEEQNNVVVGVIDGGFPSDSILMNELYEYNDNLSLGFGSINPSGAHAEQVCSTLLWHNKLGNRSDKITSPKVSLFNVVGNDNILILKNKIQNIISTNTSIKLWNISFVFIGIKSSKIISELGVFFDKLQKEYGILCFIATGNKSKEDTGELINSPSGSYSAMSIGAVNENYIPTHYSKKGYGKELPTKPDLSIFGGSNTKPIRVLSNNMVSKTGGTSFSTPLVLRKAAYLFDNGFDIYSIPAILNNYAQYYSFKNNIKISSEIGNGVLPVDTTELVNLIDNKLMIVIRKDINENYSQGFLDIKLPKNENSKYDFSFFVSTNVGYRSEENPTFEYILESARISFGKAVSKENKLLSETADKRIPDNYEEGTHERALRIYKGKFKNRDTFMKFRKRATKDTFSYNGTKISLDKWGIRIVRNSMKGGRNSNLPIAISIIFESPSILDFYQKFILENRMKLELINEVAPISVEQTIDFV